MSRNLNLIDRETVIRFKLMEINSKKMINRILKEEKWCLICQKMKPILYIKMIDR